MADHLILNAWESVRKAQVKNMLFDQGSVSGVAVPVITHQQTKTLKYEVKLGREIDFEVSGCSTIAKGKCTVIYGVLIKVLKWDLLSTTVIPNHFRQYVKEEDFKWSFSFRIVRYFNKNVFRLSVGVNFSCFLVSLIEILLGICKIVFKTV